MMDSFVAPTSYARHLATYIKCPSTIRARTFDQFGRGPSLERCRKYRDEVEQRERREALHLEHRARDVNREFSCGHPRDFENTIEREGRDRCLTCRREVERTVAERCRAKAIDRLALEPLEQPRLRGRLLPRDLLELTARLFKTSPAELCGKSRFREHVVARGVLSSVLRSERDMSYPQIGKMLGGRDHSTIINAVQKLEIYRRDSELVDDAIEALTEAARRRT